MSTTITIQGNLTREPELRITGSGGSSCALSVAVNRKAQARNEHGFVETVTYFSVVAFNALANNACETLRKGSRVVVTGRLDQRNWETAGGEKRTSYELVADDIGASLKWAAGTLKRSDPMAAVAISVAAPPLPAAPLPAAPVPSALPGESDVFATLVDVSASA